MPQDDNETDRLVDAVARAIGLPIPAERRRGVRESLERARRTAQPLLELELDDRLTGLPVYRP